MAATVRAAAALGCGLLIGLASGCAEDGAASDGPQPGDTAVPKASPPETGAGGNGPAAASPAYVGRASCGECHAEQVRAWTGSDHDRAMDHATRETVLADFDDSVFTDAGVTTRFFRDAGRFLVRAEGPAGVQDTFEVKYVFGVQPLQQYLVEFPDGRVQCLSVAWDTVQGRWFSLYPGQAIPHDDWLHWTGPAQNWNTMCAECHTTDLQKNYDLETDTFHTTFAEIDVSCEACHGPAGDHVRWAREGGGVTGGADGGPGGWLGPYGLVARLEAGDLTLKDRQGQRFQVDVCGRCHVRRHIVHPEIRLDRPLLDAFAPELLREGLYFADGQIRDEVYVYGSFLQSSMYQQGVRCTDCHDPHSAELRAEGNALCTRCHEPERFDTTAHHHHAAGSSAARCVQCHMAERTYMVVDPRRDHGFHLPRPDLTLAVGVPNACNGCHESETAQWASDQVVEWYGPERPADIHFARLMAAGRRGDPAAEQGLVALVRRPDAAAIVRATALWLLARYDGARVRTAALAALEDDEALVRGTAIHNVEALPMRQRARALVPLLDDPSRFVRTEAARALARAAGEGVMDGREETARRFWSALAEYREGQQAASDMPASNLNLAVLHENLGDEEAAEAAYRAALRLDSGFAPARINLAMLLARNGRSRDAEQQFLRVIDLQPQMADAHYSLGLLLAEDPARLDEAAAALATAAGLAPSRARIQYNAGLAQQRLGRPADAHPLLLAAYELDPHDPDFLHALAVFHLQQQQWVQALPYAEALVATLPDADPPQQLLQRIRSQLR